MKRIIRYLVLFALLIAALAAYSYGNQTGLFVFVLLGFAFEACFWFGVFPLKRK